MGLHPVRFIRTKLGARVSLFLSNPERDAVGEGLFLNLSIKNGPHEFQHAEIFLDDDNIVALIQGLSESLEEIRAIRYRKEG